MQARQSEFKTASWPTHASVLNQGYPCQCHVVSSSPLSSEPRCCRPVACPCCSLDLSFSPSQLAGLAWHGARGVPDAVDISLLVRSHPRTAEQTGGPSSRPVSSSLRLGSPPRYPTPRSAIFGHMREARMAEVAREGVELEPEQRLPPQTSAEFFPPCPLATRPFRSPKARRSRARS